MKPFAPPPFVAELRALVESRRLDEAEKMLGLALVAEPGVAEVHHLASILRLNQGRTDEALDEIRLAIRLDAASLEFRNLLVGLLSRLGRDDEAGREAAAALAVAPSILGTDLSRAFAELDPGRDGGGGFRPFLDWAWSVSGRPGNLHAVWEEGVRWGLAANRLLHAWITFNRGAFASLDAMVRRPDWEPVRRCLERGRGVLLAPLHFGPKMVPLEYLVRSGPPAKWVSANIAYGITSGSPGFVNSLVGDLARVTLSLCHHLQDGGLVYVAADGHQASRFQPVNILGRRFGLPLGPAVLAFHGRAAVFWYSARFEQDYLRVDLEPGPGPEGDEDFDSWCRRWFATLAMHLSARLRGQPENFQPGDGIARQLAS